jgi:hypothetical protein
MVSGFPKSRSGYIIRHKSDFANSYITTYTRFHYGVPVVTLLFLTGLSLTRGNRDSEATGLARARNL